MSFACADISVRIKVCERRGHVLTIDLSFALALPTVPSFGRHAGCAEVLGQAPCSSSASVCVDRWFISWVVCLLQAAQDLVCQLLGRKLFPLDDIDQTSLSKQSRARLLLGAGPRSWNYQPLLMQPQKLVKRVVTSHSDH